MMKEEPLSVVSASVAPKKEEQNNVSISSKLYVSPPGPVNSLPIQHSVSDLTTNSSLANGNIFSVSVPPHHPHHCTIEHHRVTHLPSSHFVISAQPSFVPSLNIEDDDEEVEPVIWQPKQGVSMDNRKEKKRKKEKKKEDDEDESCSSPKSTPSKKNKVLAECDDEKCLALKRGGDQCLKKRKKDSKYCGSHDGAERRYGEVLEGSQQSSPIQQPSGSPLISNTTNSSSDLHSEPKESKQTTTDSSDSQSSSQSSDSNQVDTISNISPTISVPNETQKTSSISPVEKPTAIPLLDQQINQTVNALRKNDQSSHGFVNGVSQSIVVGVSSSANNLYIIPCIAGETRELPVHVAAGHSPNDSTPVATPMANAPIKNTQINQAPSSTSVASIPSHQTISPIPPSIPIPSLTPTSQIQPTQVSIPLSNVALPLPSSAEHAKKVPGPTHTTSHGPSNTNGSSPSNHSLNGNHINNGSSSPNSHKRPAEDEDKKKRKKKSKKEREESATVSLQGFSYLETDGLVEIWIREVKKGIRTKRGRCVGTVKSSNGQEVVCGKVFARVPNCRRHSRLVHKAQQQAIEDQRRIQPHQTTPTLVTNLNIQVPPTPSTVNPNAVNSMASALNNGTSAHGHAHGSATSSNPATPTTPTKSIMDAIVVSMDEEEDDSFDDEREDELERDFDDTQGDDKHSELLNLNDDELDEDSKGKSANQTDFVQCESCHKWRRVPVDTIDELPEQWYCYMNPDSRFNNCSVEQEMPDWEIDKELQLETIYIKSQFYPETRRESDPDYLYHEEKTAIQSEFDKLYDSLFHNPIKREIKSL